MLQPATTDPCDPKGKVREAAQRRPERGYASRRTLLGLCTRNLTVNLLPVAHFDHQNSSFIVSNGIDDAICALPEAKLFLAGEFLAARGSWVFRKGLDFLDDSLAVSLGDALDLSNGGRFDEDPIAFHASSGL